MLKITEANSRLNISTLRPDRSLPLTTPARPPTHVNWTPWPRSLPYVGRRRALHRSNVATMAHDEVSRSGTGIRTQSVDSSAAFHPAQASLAAQNFNMPALSPTMTEGNIATWKLKEGTTDPTSAPRTQRGISLAQQWPCWEGI
jgi:hypothetical protein